MRLQALLFVCLCLAAPARSQDFGGGGFAGSTQCIGPAERARIDVARADYVRRFGPLSTPESAPGKFTFYPMAGKVDDDLFTINYNDLDPTLPGILDWDCTSWTYDGHDASDTLVRSFGEQAIGVPVFAALDGVVTATFDGNPDMNTSCAGNPMGNGVLVDHGSGRECVYWHFKNGSVAVSVGQAVKAGQQLGLAASSGCSDWPHLHFATYDSNFTVSVEPFAGPCRPGPSDWVDQRPVFRDFKVADLNVTNVSISGQPGLPFDIPRTGTFVTGPTTIWFWATFYNLPAGATWRVRFLRPDATAAVDFNNSFGPGPFWRWTWWWWVANPNLNQTGTWTILLDVNGQTVETAPFDVVASPAGLVNRAPEPVTAHIQPSRATTDDVLICCVANDLVEDDRDYDIVRYRYEWRVNGALVRDVTNAALSDVLARHTAPPGSLVTCDVTPSDGIDSAPTFQAAVRLEGGFTFCTAKAGLVCGLPAISGSGTASATASSGFVVRAAPARDNRTGILVYNTAQVVAIPFQGGFLCIQPMGLRRAGATNSMGTCGGGCSGAFAIDMNAFASGNWVVPDCAGAPSATPPNNPAGYLTSMGTSVYGQFWGRDSQATGSFLSDGLCWTVGP